ncbi:anthranilate synthase component 2 [Butyrivibrio fibrisolvens DSM 3071]|uniref:Anthranilate synthase component 2 n=1 Tax=Butyrivibrio fibrisolvens DSM 3071 TaxID=1121131 RepID=A0A1M5W627_BUTFI|nr:aminodeoxychorismate/anthranilate synthase component II [Butyrivibrio fibrisolvens]SHH82946.1 anthranilate synthase component 2 [Butyrivibrio fibrisolvens DSM 3071]
MILLIDNYDSFTYNLYQYIGTLEPDIKAVRNDKITLDEIKELNPKAIILSPGPGKPKDAGICEDVVARFGDSIPILGVCLGHQAICEYYGGTVDHATRLMHGKQSDTKIDTSSPLFTGMTDIIKVARYHSLSLKEGTVPDCLKVIARADDGEIMAVQHKEYKVFGVQFHPESIMTPQGMDILRNFVHRITSGVL